MADSNVAGASVTREQLREECDRLRSELFRYCATKADVADLKARLVSVLLVGVLNVCGAVGAHVAVLIR